MGQVGPDTLVPDSAWVAAGAALLLLQEQAMPAVTQTMHWRSVLTRSTAKDKLSWIAPFVFPTGRPVRKTCHCLPETGEDSVNTSR